MVESSAKDITVPQIKRGKKITLPIYADVQKVKGIFRNLEYPGTAIRFPFRDGWRGPIKNFTFFDGSEYEIPKTLAKHLNERCCYKTLKWVAEDGTSTTAKPLSSASMPGFTQQINKKTHRFMFQITG